MKNTLKYFLGIFLLFSVCAWSKASDILIVVDDEMILDKEIRNAIITYTDDIWAQPSLEAVRRHIAESPCASDADFAREVTLGGSRENSLVKVAVVAQRFLHAPKLAAQNGCKAFSPKGV